MGERASTKGPWVCYADLPSTEPNWHIVTTANRLRVLANVHIEPSNPMDAANARLITAAPDLLEALHNAAGLLDTPLARRRHAGDEFYAEVVASIRLAIAKAEGRAILADATQNPLSEGRERS